MLVVAVAKNEVEDRFVGSELKETRFRNEMGIECFHRPVVREGLMKELQNYWYGKK